MIHSLFEVAQTGLFEGLHCFLFTLLCVLVNLEKIKVNTWPKLKCGHVIIVYSYVNAQLNQRTEI